MKKVAGIGLRIDRCVKWGTCLKAVFRVLVVPLNLGVDLWQLKPCTALYNWKEHANLHKTLVNPEDPYKPDTTRHLPDMVAHRRPRLIDRAPVLQARIMNSTALTNANVSH